MFLARLGPGNQSFKYLCLYIHVLQVQILWPPIAPAQMTSRRSCRTLRCSSPPSFGCAQGHGTTEMRFGVAHRHVIAHCHAVLILFLQAHIPILETTDEGKQALLMGLEYLVNIAFVDDEEVTLDLHFASTVTFYSVPARLADGWGWADSLPGFASRCSTTR